MRNVLQQIRGSVKGRHVTKRAVLPWAILLVLVAGVAAALGMSRAATPGPELAARVNGEPVTRDEVQRLLADPLARRQLQQQLGGHQPDPAKLERLALRTLINRRLILQEAARRNITVSKDDLTKATSDLRQRFKDLKEFGAWLQARGLHDESLQATLRDDLLITRAQAALVEGVKVTDEQVQAYYQQNKANIKAADSVRLRMIVVKDKPAAEAIVAGLKKGEPFERLAKERSLAGADKGGDLGWVNPARLLPPLREAVPTLKVGQTSAPLERGEQFLLVRVEERKPAHALDLAEARPAIERYLVAAKQQEIVQAWLTDQTTKSKIEVLLRAESTEQKRSAFSGQLPASD